jgi:hypothetical protein
MSAQPSNKDFAPMSENKPISPRQSRQKIIQNAARLRIILAPLLLLLRCAAWLSRISGLESALYRFVFKIVSLKFNSRMKQAFAGYTPTATDVFVCSYFKAGTNWTMQIAYQIARRGQGEYENIHDVIPWPDAPIKGMAVTLSGDPLLKQAATGLRVIKTHSEAHSVPYTKQAKYICVVRDPKDVFVSSYFYVRSVIMGKLMPTVAAWLDVYLSDAALHGQWADFLNGYWQWRNQPNVLFLTYEEMKDDLAGAVRQIAVLMGVDLTDDEFERVCYLSSYAHMKSIGEKFYPGRVSPLSLPKGEMIRSGNKGKSDEILSPRQQERIDAYCHESLRRLGCDFPYNSFYATKPKA